MPEKPHVLGWDNQYFGSMIGGAIGGFAALAHTMGTAIGRVLALNRASFSFTAHSIRPGPWRISRCEVLARRIARRRAGPTWWWTLRLLWAEHLHRVYGDSGPLWDLCWYAGTLRAHHDHRPRP